MKNGGYLISTILITYVCTDPASPSGQWRNFISLAQRQDKCCNHTTPPIVTSAHGLPHCFPLAVTLRRLCPQPALLPQMPKNRTQHSSLATGGVTAPEATERRCFLEAWSPEANVSTASGSSVTASSPAFRYRFWTQLSLACCQTRFVLTICLTQPTIPFPNVDWGLSW